MYIYDASTDVNNSLQRNFNTLWFTEWLVVNTVHGKKLKCIVRKTCKTVSRRHTTSRQYNCELVPSICHEFGNFSKSLPLFLIFFTMIFICP